MKNVIFEFVGVYGVLCMVFFHNTVDTSVSEEAVILFFPIYTSFRAYCVAKVSLGCCTTS